MNEALVTVWTGPDVLGVHKPPGLPCFRPHSDPDGDCVLARLLEEWPELADHTWPLGFDAGIAHRLDISTSGLLLVARSPAALLALRSRFSERRLDKTYLFLTSRDVPWDRNACGRPIAHARRRKGRVVVQRGNNTPHRGRWRDAETHFERVGPVDGGLWLWRATMRTGVMHQIRVHSAFVGLALAGDRVYGGGELALARPDGVDFALHHVGLEGDDLHPTKVPPPAWWPELLPQDDPDLRDPSPRPARSRRRRRRG